MIEKRFDRMTKHFQYDDEAIEYLKSKDKTLAQVIDVVGHVNRPIDGDVFTSVINSIISQQVSTAGAKTVLGRLDEQIGIDPDGLSSASADDIQACGTTFRKAEYIKGFVDAVASGDFDLDALESMPDEEAIAYLSSIKGIGQWTSEMILLFSLNRMNIFAFDDIGIQRGMRMTYHHRQITRPLFEKYRRRFSPYCSVASLYFWEVAHGTVPGFQKDFAPKRA